MKDKMEVEDTERLAGHSGGSGGLQGGLQSRKRERREEGGSKYGLDKLADQKRREKREKELDKDVFVVPMAVKPSRSNRNYRRQDFDTPGGTPRRSFDHDRDELSSGRAKDRDDRKNRRGLEYKSDRRHTGRSGDDQKRSRSNRSNEPGSISYVSSRPDSTRREFAPNRVGWDGRTPKRSTWDRTPTREDVRRIDRIRNTPMTDRLPAFVTADEDQITEEEMKAIEEEEKRLDREWYLQDDDDGRYYESSARETGPKPVGNQEEELARNQAKKLSARAAQQSEDAKRWEEHQMKLGGVKGNSKELSMDFSEDDGPKVMLMVKDTVPPFLEGKEGDTTVADTVVPIKDPTSDMAVVARKGSELVKRQREKREQSRGRQKYWELGTKSMGAKEESATKELKEKAEMEESLLKVKSQQEEDESGAGRKSMQYGEALKKDRKVATHESIAEIARQRRSLPVFTVRDQLLQVIRDNQVVIIVGETGSGKTTQLTQYLNEEGYGRKGMIGCTQPRRVAAVSVAKRVAEEMNVDLSKQVGYAIRFEDCTSRETIIKYMTDGILLRETLSDDDLDAYSCIVMDEAHERSLNTDVLFGVLRKVLTRRRDLKVIVTSATLNADRFADFFGRAPIFNIPGRTFPVDVFYAKSTVEDYVEGAVKQVIQIHLQAPLPGDILVFMTGQEDIEVTCEIIADRMSKLEDPPPLIILPIYSQLAADMQARIFEPAPEGARKVVVATNIAETSLTVNGVSFVVDAGYCKLKTYNPRVGMDALLLCPTSRASANQRSGRAGRTGPGRAYRLFTANAMANEMLESSVPEIQRTNLSHVVLLLKSLGVRDLLEFDFMDPPPEENIVKSMHGLWMLGALDSHGNLTDLGRRMATFPLDPPLAKMLLAGEREGCSQEVATIVAMLSVPSVFFRPRDREEEADAAREKFFVPESDHLTLLHVYQRWRSGGERADWCAKHFLNARGLRRAKEVRSQLIEVMKDEKIALTTCGTDWDSIRKAVTSAYFHQAAKMKGIGEYINMRSAVVCAVHPTSSLYGAGFTPDYVVYHELIYTQKEYMSCVTVVEPQWLAEMGPMFFTLKYSGGRTLKTNSAAAGEEQSTPYQDDVSAASSVQNKIEKSRKRANARGLVTPGRRDKVPRTPARFGM